MTRETVIDEVLDSLRAACSELGIRVSGDGRISERDAETLLGMSPRRFEVLRAMGDAPVAVHIGGRRTYRLHDLARYIAERRR